MTTNKPKINAGTIALAFLMEGEDSIVATRLDEGPLLFNGKHFVSNAGRVKKRIHQFILENYSPKYATARMVNEVLDTITIAIFSEDGPRPHFVGRPKEIPESILGLSNGNLVIAEDGTFKLVNHSPETLTTHVTEYEFDETGATCPKFEKFMDWFTCGNETLKTYVLMLVASVLCRFLDLQKIPIFFGEGGNGKGVLFNAIQKLVGKDAVSALSMNLLGARFNSDLRDKWVNIDADLSETSKVREGKLKKLADGSPIRYEGKFKNPITAACFAMFFFATNLLFAFRDRSNGMGRRVVYIPCNASVDKGQVVQRLEDTFCMSGVLNRVLQVVPELVSEGLIDCPAVNELTKQARQEANPASLFLQERICLKTGGKLIKKEVYRVYRDWCEDNGYKPLSHLNFGREVARHFSKQVKSGEVNLSGKVSEYAVRHNAYVGIEYRIDRESKRNESRENLPAKKLSNSDSSADEHREIEAMLERIGEAGK